MPNENAVINASPFILLCKSGLAEMLPGLFAEIFMPEAVSDEIIRGDDAASQKLLDYRKNWLKICSVKTVEDVLVWNLGNGETEVLSFAFENKSKSTALIDDRAARKCAETLNLKTLGTGGILILAKNRGLIENVAVELKNLQSAGLWISNEIVNTILKQAGE
jgi:predicted nucleic acid-binding protein